MQQISFETRLLLSGNQERVGAGVQLDGIELERGVVEDDVDRVGGFDVPENDLPIFSSRKNLVLLLEQDQREDRVLMLLGEFGGDLELLVVDLDDSLLGACEVQESLLAVQGQ